MNTGRVYKANFSKLAVNICVATFSSDHTPEHDHFPLIRRCLDSIVENTSPEMYRLHIGCNNLSPRAMAYVDGLVASQHAIKYIGKPVKDSQGKTVYPKYPLMREMYRATAGRTGSPEATDWVVWFDDDSHVTGNDWLERLEEKINSSRHVHQLGNMSIVLLNAREIDLVVKLPWFNTAIGIPTATIEDGTQKPGCYFIQGGFYALSRYAIRTCSIPDKHLFHNDGDWTTGLALLHKGLKLDNFTYGVKIDDAPRRGMHMDKWVEPDHPEMTEKPWIT